MWQSNTCSVGKLKHVAIKHTFLQQLLRQKVFTINKIPTRANPADLNTKKLSVERRKLLSILCGLYPLCVETENEEETLMSRRVHRHVASKLAQVLQVISIGLLQGCVCDDVLSGHFLRGEEGLQSQVPEQDHGWNYIDFKVYFTVFVLVSRPIHPRSPRRSRSTRRSEARRARRRPYRSTT